MIGRRVLGTGLALGVLLAGGVTVLPAASGAPMEQLRARIDQVIKTLENPDLRADGKVRERRVAIRKVADQIFDFGETAKRSLARHWVQRTPAEREEFTGLFADLLERSYILKVELFNGERITYVGETVDGDQALVRTRIVTKQGSEIPVDYRMLRRGDRWLVYDVVIEGVSLISNYRTQFNKIIQTSSYQELVKRMKTKMDEFLDADRAKRSS